MRSLTVCRSLRAKTDRPDEDKLSFTSPTTPVKSTIRTNKYDKVTKIKDKSMCRVNIWSKVWQDKIGC